MFILQVTVFCFMLMAANLNGMHLSDHEKLIQNQEEKDEREAIRQSDQKLQAYPWPAWTHEEDKAYSIRLAELEARLTQFEKAREIGKQHAMGTQKMTKEELRAKLKREEEELRARREKDEARVQELLNISISDASKGAN